MELKDRSGEWKRCIERVKDVQKAKEQAKKLEQQFFKGIREFREEMVNDLQEEKENFEKKKENLYVEYENLIKEFMGKKEEDLKPFVSRNPIRCLTELHKLIVKIAEQQGISEKVQIAKRLLEIEKEEKEIGKRLIKRAAENKKFFEEKEKELKDNNLMRIFQANMECQYCSKRLSYIEYLTEHFLLIRNCKTKN